MGIGGLPRPSRGQYSGWKYVIRSYDAQGRFCVETVHNSDHSYEMELAAIEKCGRTAYTWNVGPDGRPVGVN